MPQREKPITAVQLIRQQSRQPKRGTQHTRPRAVTAPERQRMPRAPNHFVDAERKAWRDICRPIIERGIWRDDLRLWAESFATLLASSRSEDRHKDDHKINRASLRLYTRDIAWLVDQAPKPRAHNPFADV